MDEGELVRVDVLLDLAAEVRGLHVGIPEMDAGPDPRLQHLIGQVGEAVEEQLLAREATARDASWKPLFG